MSAWAASYVNLADGILVALACIVTVWLLEKKQYGKGQRVFDSVDEYSRPETIGLFADIAQHQREHKRVQCCHP